MIRSFADKETEKVWNRERAKFPPDIIRTALIKLQIIHAATSTEHLRIPPSNRLEKLHGDRQGQYSIRINDQWRICFKWEAPCADDVEIVDYH